MLFLFSYYGGTGLFPKLHVSFRLNDTLKQLSETVFNTEVSESSKSALKSLLWNDVWSGIHGTEWARTVPARRVLTKSHWLQSLIQHKIVHPSLLCERGWNDVRDTAARLTACPCPHRAEELARAQRGAENYNPRRAVSSEPGRTPGAPSPQRSKVSCGPGAKPGGAGGGQPSGTPAGCRELRGNPVEGGRPRRWAHSLGLCFIGWMFEQDSGTSRAAELCVVMATATALEAMRGGWQGWGISPKARNWKTEHLRNHVPAGGSKTGEKSKRVRNAKHGKRLRQ